MNPPCANAPLHVRRPHRVTPRVRSPNPGSAPIVSAVLREFRYLALLGVVVLGYQCFARNGIGRHLLGAERG